MYACSDSNGHGCFRVAGRQACLHAYQRQSAKSHSQKLMEVSVASSSFVHTKQQSSSILSPADASLLASEMLQRSPARATSEPRY